jgi:hypothetical protein
MTQTEQQFVTWSCIVLGTILLRIIYVIGNSMVSKLENIASSVEKIDKKLGILANDHTNLKEDHNELKKRVEKLEEA